jgi:hypothetical protein
MDDAVSSHWLGDLDAVSSDSGGDGNDLVGIRGVVSLTAKVARRNTTAESKASEEIKIADARVEREAAAEAENARRIAEEEVRKVARFALEVKERERRRLLEAAQESRAAETSRAAEESRAGEAIKVALAATQKRQRLRNEPDGTLLEMVQEGEGSAGNRGAEQGRQKPKLRNQGEAFRKDLTNGHYTPVPLAIPVADMPEVGPLNALPRTSLDLLTSLMDLL